MAAVAEKNAGRKKKRPSAQPRSEATKNQLLSAAVIEFSERGYDGVTIREIEEKAEVNRGLLKYHFGDKEGIWKAVVERLFDAVADYLDASVEFARDMSPKEQLAFRIRNFVRFSALHPELNRMMIQEGKHDSWRVAFIVDAFLKKRVIELQAMVDAGINMSKEDYVHWYYLYIGGGALAFSLAPEARRLFGVDVTQDAFISRHAQMMIDFLMSRCGGAESAS